MRHPEAKGLTDQEEAVMVRVIIERSVQAGKKGDLIPLLNELRSAVVRQPGYVSGETLSSIEDASTILVESTWRRLLDWRMWEESAERKGLYQKIAPLLTEKPKIRIFQLTATEGE
jgi:heme-degrading monooxygenase HmoA